MKVVMISNYINHHQIPFCNAMSDRVGEEFYFIQTEPMEEKRKKMGWGVDPHSFSYVIIADEDNIRAKRLIDESDLLIVGWVVDESILRDRLANGKPVFRISERLYREGQWKVISPKGLVRKYKDHIRYRKAPVFLLCNGAYVASDYNLIKAYPDKKYRFGYFPKTRNYYDPSELWRRKANLDIVTVEHSEELPENPPTLTSAEIQIIWAGRFLKLKHPEYMVHLAADLVRLGYRFHIHMVGGGELEDELKRLAEYELIDDYITFHGYMEPEEVRNLMEVCHIHVFTSNFLEGWGAVVNEAMNAGCAEVVNDETGVGPYLINHGKNGLLYHQGDYQDLKEKIVALFENPGNISVYGKAAYDTIITEWNAENAADKMLDFYNGYIKGERIIPQSGPMSVAPIIKPRFFASGKLED